MSYYKNNHKNNMNRAQRRKNNIKTEKIPRCNYTREQVEKIVHQELKKIMNASYSDIIKRQQYERLKPLIKEYERQRELEKQKTHTSMEFYRKQREGLKNNSTYQKLMKNSNMPKKENKQSSYTRQRAISAYERQMSFSKIKEEKIREPNDTIYTTNVDQKIIRRDKKTIKKGLFNRLSELFGIKKKTLSEKQKPVITKPQRTQTHKTYKTRTVLDEACNEFERQLRNMQNYSQNIIGYQQYRNGRPVRYTGYRERYI